MANKQLEKSFVEAARQICSLFPVGELTACECPDFLLATDAGVLGIEVTQLFQPKGAAKFARREVESFHQKVVGRAEELYCQAGGAPVDVRVYYTDHHGGKRDLDAMAGSLAHFVQTHYRVGQPPALFQRGSRPVATPEGFAVISIATPLPWATRLWWSGESGTTLLLDYELLASVIAEKNARLPHYHAIVAHVWLLIAVDLFPLSGSFSVPRMVETWKFSFDFEKVLLFSREDTRVFELSRL